MDYPLPFIAEGDTSGWLTLVTFAAGVIVAIFGGYGVHFLTHDRWWKEYRLKKLEELFLSTQNHFLGSQIFLAQWMNILNLSIENESLAEQRRESIKKLNLENDEAGKPLSTIPMLLFLYFPDTIHKWNSYYDKLINTWNHFQKITDEHPGFSANEEEDKALLHSGIKYFEEIAPELRELFNTFLEALLSEGEVIKSEKPWPSGWLLKQWERLTEG